MAAIAFNVGVAYVGEVAGFRVHAAHFHERHGLVVIIALGETNVSVGVGAAGLPLDAGVVGGALLGILLVAGLWWAYFDLTTLYAERDLVAATGKERAKLARDAYTGLHLPLIAGVIFAALGLKKTLAHVGDPLELIPAVALCGGVALYLLAHNAFRFRLVRSVSGARLVVAALCLALIPVAGSIAALSTLAVLCGLAVGLNTWETARAGEERWAMRAH